jgi:hypothetical protein
VKRPEYITCIQDTREDNLGKTLCGKNIDAFEFTFTGLDHWFNNRLAAGRLTGCQCCLYMVKRCLGSEQDMLSYEYMRPGYNK